MRGGCVSVLLYDLSFYRDICENKDFRVDKKNFQTNLTNKYKTHQISTFQTPREDENNTTLEQR